MKYSLGAVLTVSLVLSAPGIAPGPARVSAKESEQNTSLDSDHLLTREYQLSDSGLIRSHLVDSEENIYTGENAVSSASLSDRLRRGNLPETYDLRTQGLVTAIKDQGVTGCCWAFGAIKAIESNALKKGFSSSVESTDYSENHLTWFSYSPSKDSSDPLKGDGLSVSVSHTFPYINGGSATLAMFTLAKWVGPVSEASAAFQASTEEQLEAMANDMEKRQDSLRPLAELHMRNTITLYDSTLNGLCYYNDPDAVSAMKQLIIEHGVMDIALYYDKKYMKTSEAGGTAYYQQNYIGSSAIDHANHCVAIVGWDDNYPRSNFASTPLGNGAWLIANSYGADSGDEGYFWLSYYESSICDCFIFDMESSTNYDHIYQYDGFGWGQALYSTTMSPRAGNIFTADPSSPQEISAVSLYTLSDRQQYQIQLYREVPANADSPAKGILIEACTTSGVAERCGYHTIPLSSPVSVKAGERFAIVVTYVQNGSTKAYVPFEGTGQDSTYYSMEYSSSRGQSFIYYPWYGSKPQWIDTNILGYNNTCIKAFSKNTTQASELPPSADNTDNSGGTASGGTNSKYKHAITAAVTATGIKLSKSSITLGKRETIRIISDQTLSFSTLDSGVATITNVGLLSANNVGSTKITISANGNSAKLKVKVKKAPSKAKISPAKTKKIKKGKSFQAKLKLPSGAASYKRTWSSSNKKVATVSDKGKVTALKKGTAYIKVRTYNKKTARLKVVVKK